jgi:hypothetical protein
VEPEAQAKGEVMNLMRLTVEPEAQAKGEVIYLRLRFRLNGSYCNAL